MTEANETPSTDRTPTIDEQLEQLLAGQQERLQRRLADHALEMRKLRRSDRRALYLRILSILIFFIGLGLYSYYKEQRVKEHAFQVGAKTTALVCQPHIERVLDACAYEATDACRMHAVDLAKCLQKTPPR